MPNETNNVFDLRRVARDAMRDEGFTVDLSHTVIAEINQLSKRNLADEPPGKVLNLRDLLWSSIDNEDSRDLDQLEVAEQLENQSIRLRIGIADVDSVVSQNSATDFYAAQNTTSVYTGIQTFPMLPRVISEDITSLLEGVDRLAVIVDFTVSGDGGVTLNQIYRALIHNHAKLDYETVGAWLSGGRAAALLPAGDADLRDGIEAQLRLQSEAAARLRRVRMRAGALEFGTVEATTIRRGDDVFELIVKDKNQARYVIENLMITANVLIAQFLENQNYPALERVVRRPERWQRIVELAATLGETLPTEPDSRSLASFLEKRRVADPVHFSDLSLSIVKLIGSGDYAVVPPGAEGDGHFGLAVNDYAHSTAPNRRYADLVTQRLVKAAISRVAPPYTVAQLEEIAARCNERQTAERKVERLMRKMVAAQVLSRRIGETFDGIITGVSKKGVFARLLTPPAEGRIVSGEENLDVGDRVQVRLIKTIPEKGFIDFERV